jgi:uncharacterized protein involved in response to NO
VARAAQSGYGATTISGDRSAAERPSIWRREPFRIFFPLGTVLAWVGIGHWVAYEAGWLSTYSCLAHGLVQVQGFLLAFALGFLLTALPRRTQSAPAAGWAIVAAAVALVVSTGAAFLGRWWIAEGLTIAIVAGIVVFALRRFVAGGGGRRPPAAFVLLPLGFACGVAGASLVAWGTVPGGPPAAVGAGRLFLEQGFFLCLVMGAGALVLPLMSGAPPPQDLGESPAGPRQVVGYAAAGLAVVASLGAEACGSDQLAPMIRGGVVAVTLALGAGLLTPLERPGWNRRLARLAAWLVPTGIVLSGAVPAYRVPALHVTFIGGFALLAFTVATHVTASHLDLPELRDGRAPLVAITAGAILVAMLGRVTADATQTYFEHLASAGAVWIAGTGVWVVTLMRHWIRSDE